MSRWLFPNRISKQFSHRCITALLTHFTRQRHSTGKSLNCRSMGGQHVGDRCPHCGTAHERSGHSAGGTRDYAKNQWLSKIGGVESGLQYTQSNLRFRITKEPHFLKRNRKRSYVLRA
jgi:hypothetical protein